MCFGRKKDKNDKNRMKFEKEYPERAAEEPRRRRKIMGRVYAGPDMKDVYGGPEYFERRGLSEEHSVKIDDTGKAAAENDEKTVLPNKKTVLSSRKSKNDDKMSMGTVYAGPDYFENMSSDDET